jgi:hypothetical protein
MEKIEYIKIGDEVTYKPKTDEPATTAKVTHIEKLKKRGENTGVPVRKIAVPLLELAIMDLDNGRWCYGYQVIK